MKKKVFKGTAFLAFFAVSVTVNAQATRLNFPIENTIDHEFGYSTVEYNGYSVIGTEFNQTIQVFNQGNYMFTAKDSSNSGFGHSIGMNQDWIAAGARGYDASPNDGNIYSGEGAVFLSKTVYGTPKNNFTIKLTAQNPLQNDRYGESLDMDGQWMVVGADQNYNVNGSGFVELWKQTGSGWTRNAVISPWLAPAGAKFGYSVALRGDYLVVGAPGIKKIFLYRLINGTWSYATEYTPNLPTWGKENYGTFESTFGWDVDITDGHLIVGDPKAEKAALFNINGNQITLAKTFIHPSDPGSFDGRGSQFGHSVAIQYNRALVGAPNSYYRQSSATNPQGNIFMFTDGYEYKGRMHVGTPAGYVVRGLGRSIAIASDNVLGGAEYSANLTIPSSYNFASIFANAYGAAFRMPFWQVYVNGSQRTTEVEINDFDSNEGLSIYPNPSKGDFVTANINGTINNVQLISTSGEILTLNYAGKSISLNGLAKGVYVLKISTETEVKSEKLVIE